MGFEFALRQTCGDSRIAGSLLEIGVHRIQIRIQNVWIRLGSGSGPDPKSLDPDPAGSFLNTTNTE